MLLSHETTTKYIIQILKQNELKSNALTGLLNQGEGIYSYIDKVFFRAVKKIEDICLPEGDVILYFDPKILFNKSFWVSTTNSVDTNCKTKHTKNIGWSNDPQYQMKYKQYYQYTNNVLKKLYLHSRAAGSHCIANSVTVINNIKIKNHLNTVVISMPESKKKQQILKLLKEKYPETKVYTNYWPTNETIGQWKVH